MNYYIDVARNIYWEQMTNEENKNTHIVQYENNCLFIFVYFFFSDFNEFIDSQVQEEVMSRVFFFPTILTLKKKTTFRIEIKIKYKL